MTIEEVLQHDLKFRYMLLGRLQADCEYYLGFGNKSSRRLWAGSEKTQIEYMTKIHDSFRENEKPEWLTMEQIKEYSNAMGVTQKKKKKNTVMTFNGGVAVLQYYK